MRTQASIQKHLRKKWLTPEEHLQIREIEIAQKVEGLNGGYVQMKVVPIPRLQPSKPL